MIRKLNRLFPGKPIIVALLAQDKQRSELVEITQLLASNDTAMRFSDTLKLIDAEVVNKPPELQQPARASA